MSILSVVKFRQDTHADGPSENYRHRKAVMLAIDMSFVLHVAQT